MADPGTWIEEGRLLACAYPRRDESLAGLSGRGISLLINLAERAHADDALRRHGLTQIHLPTRDFRAPSPEALDRGVAAIAEALATGKGVAVHCGGGLGRTGTLIACYLVTRGIDPEAAIARVRAVRPGSVETARQVAAIREFGARQQDPTQT